MFCKSHGNQAVIVVHMMVVGECVRSSRSELPGGGCCWRVTSE